MCVNATTSLAAFICGIFTIIAMIIIIPSPTIIAIGLIWLWVLFMQLSEYLIWIDQKCGKVNNLGTNMALIFNLTQPIFAYLVLINISTNIPVVYKYSATSVILLYICTILYQMNNNSKFTCIKPSDKCIGLNLDWWNKFKNSGFIYLITLLAIILLLVRPMSIAIFSSLFIIIALLISMKFYSCNSPSMWCLLVVVYPLFLTLFVKILKIKV
jgi:hypothetical protein